jgi:uroporphyrin-III C-methyltransferase
MTDSLSFLPSFNPGTVWLVGAGPGDPGLISLLAHHALKTADWIVHDSLVSEGVLALANPMAVVESVGKRGGQASPKQSDINQRLIDLAKQGLRVLLLKGGDPFVFGRGADEALALTGAGIAFRVVPGVTAGVGGLAYAGIPTTQRDMNSAVAFVTGHGQDGNLPSSFDWESLAKGAPVLVFYMALRQLEQVVAHLVSAGRSPDEPAAIVSKAATADQLVLESTLGGILDVVATRRPPPPAMLVVGPVVGLRKQLAWWNPGGE